MKELYEIERLAFVEQCAQNAVIDLNDPDARLSAVRQDIAAEIGGLFGIGTFPAVHDCIPEKTRSVERAFPSMAFCAQSAMSWKNPLPLASACAFAAA